jgi:hypothetical protein
MKLQIGTNVVEVDESFTKLSPVIHDLVSDLGSSDEPIPLNEEMADFDSLLMVIEFYKNYPVDKPTVIDYADTIRKMNTCKPLPKNDDDKNMVLALDTYELEFLKKILVKPSSVHPTLQYLNDVGTGFVKFLFNINLEIDVFQSFELCNKAMKTADYLETQVFMHMFTQFIGYFFKYTVRIDMANEKAGKPTKITAQALEFIMGMPNDMTEEDKAKADEEMKWLKELEEDD